MKVKLLLNIGTEAKGFPPLKKGEHEVSDDLGLALIERGWALPLEEKPARRQQRAVPSPPTIKGTPKKPTPPEIVVPKEGDTSVKRPAPISDDE